MKKTFEKQARYLGLYLSGAAFALVLFDCLVFWAFDRRPVLSNDAGWIAIWSVLIATAISLATRFTIQRKSWQRFSLAAVLAIAVMTSSMHPWLNGWGVQQPEIQTIERDLPDAVMEFPEEILSEGRPV
ncbi:MAG: hypothetical protein ACYTDT_12955 [Planctomycetota bacterium]|jgi:hypothetical protein